MYLTLVVVGLALALIGSGLMHAQRASFTRATAVGLALFVVGEVLLYGAAWWWALIGLFIPGFFIGVIMNVISTIRGPR